MSDEFRDEEFRQANDSMKIVDEEKLSEPEVNIRQNDYAPQADAYPQADEYQQNPEKYQQYQYRQQSYNQQQYYGQQQNYNQQQSYYGQQQGYGQQTYYGEAEQPKETGIGFGIASLVLGILALLLFCSCINYILAILAIIFGIVQLTRTRNNGLAIAGIVTAGISIILSIFMWVGFFMISEDGDNPFNTYLEQYYEEYYNDNGDF